MSIRAVVEELLCEEELSWHLSSCWPNEEHQNVKGDKQHLYFKK